MGNKVKKPKYSISRPHKKDLGVGKLSLDKPVSIHTGVNIDLTGNVTIGKYAEIQSRVKIFTHKHHWNHSRKRRAEIQKVEKVDLTIGSDAFIGFGATILAVKRIGKGAVIGAGSVLTKSVPDFEVWAGNPAKKIGERKNG